MYFPYLRGKQFELIALREMISIMSENKDKISPVIEPVRNSSTFNITIKELANNNINFNIIVNPKVGDLVNNTGTILDIIKREIPDFNNYQIAIIIDEKTDVEEIISTIKKNDLSFTGLTLIHNSIISNIEDIIEHNDVVYNLISLQKTSKRYYRKFEDYTRVELDDNFISQQKNSDYLLKEDTFFSEEHLYYKEEGFIGFADYLTIGEPYSESGFLPYAVAIHISYADKKNKIRIKHFVSDSNEDTSDIAGKFAEALDKLIDWANSNGINSEAMNIFRDLYKNKHFPGLGSVKKLSIMHHIELVLNLI
jgi:hypothetical protein